MVYVVWNNMYSPSSSIAEGREKASVESEVIVNPLVKVWNTMRSVTTQLLSRVMLSWHGLQLGFKTHRCLLLHFNDLQSHFSILWFICQLMSWIQSDLSLDDSCRSMATWPSSELCFNRLLTVCAHIRVWTERWKEFLSVVASASLPSFQAHCVHKTL